jgi:hypothetical protein
VCGDEVKIREIFEFNGAKIAALGRLPNGDYDVKFSISDENYNHLLAKISGSDLFLKKFGSIDLSLEEIFLYSTRRCRDQDVGDEP